MNLQELPRPKKEYIVFTLKKQLEEKTESGIIVPTAVSEDNMFVEAEVKAIGESSDKYKVQCKVGDRILVKRAFARLTDLTFKVKGEPHYFCREESDFFGWL